MTNRTAALKARIDPLQQELAQVRAAKTEAARALATDAKALEPMRAAARREAELREEIGLIEAALACAAADDAVDQHAATRRELDEKVKRIRALLQGRTKAAQAMDKSFDVLREAVQGWIEANREIRSASRDVYDLLAAVARSRGEPYGRQMWDRVATQGDTSGPVAAALAAQMCGATKGLSLNEFVAFKYPGLASPTLIADSVAKHNDRILGEIGLYAARFDAAVPDHAADLVEQTH